MHLVEEKLFGAEQRQHPTTMMFGPESTRYAFKGLTQPTDLAILEAELKA